VLLASAVRYEDARSALRVSLSVETTGAELQLLADGIEQLGKRIAA
jgi:cysteine sulfinate desulfinase/cysteine desulfurase-like protein